jgi:hypothetical protein
MRTFNKEKAAEFFAGMVAAKKLHGLGSKRRGDKKAEENMLRTWHCSQLCESTNSRLVL